MNKTINRSKLVFMLFLLVIFACENQKTDNENLAVTKDDGTRLILKKEDLLNGNYHTQHAKLFGKYVSGYNVYVLRAIDLVQSSAMDGGGYFIGIKADPPESPIGYNIELFGNKLLQAPRKTSYCSGSSYSVFIESLNLMYGNKPHVLSKERHEAIRMQELDNGRREDGIKFWGNWNADGYGNNFALVQYSGMGKKVSVKYKKLCLYVYQNPKIFLHLMLKNK
ncbi:MAG: hypothetical protein B6I20_00700 [Bacteroidetes bacterium 4572_117]|nr:MAG: hypothetical protein B6I20_00700 [Bacteroidetes bacterium 4572_117]